MVELVAWGSSPRSVLAAFSDESLTRNHSTLLCMTCHLRFPSISFSSHQMPKLSISFLGFASVSYMSNLARSVIGIPHLVRSMISISRFPFQWDFEVPRDALIINLLDSSQLCTVARLSLPHVLHARMNRPAPFCT